MPKSAEKLEAARLRAQAQQREQMTSLLVVAGTVIVIFLVFIVIITRSSAPQVSSAPEGKYGSVAQGLTADGLPILGVESAKFQIMEFSDFGCPFCLQYKPVIDELIEKQVKTGNIRFVFAPQLFHGNPSVYSTRAAFCAERQGKFWEMHDELFVVQSTQGTSGFEVGNLKANAEKIGLDTKKWLDCVATTETETAARKSYDLFIKIGAEGTPTMVWSKDGGQTWNYFMSNGQPFKSGGVPITLINQTIADSLAGKL